MRTDKAAADRASTAYAAAAFDVMEAECLRPHPPAEMQAMLDARAAILRAFVAVHRGDRLSLAVSVDRFRRCCLAAGIDPDATADEEVRRAA